MVETGSVPGEMQARGGRSQGLGADEHLLSRPRGQPEQRYVADVDRSAEAWGSPGIRDLGRHQPRLVRALRGETIGRAAKLERRD